VEEVSIPAGTNNLVLRSVQIWAAVIKAPALMLGPTKSIVRVNGATGVTLLAFTITGPGGFGCDSLRYGVRVDSGGSADILGNHITHIRDDPFSGCQNGVAILVGRQLEMTTGKARIYGNVIDDYQKNGPTVGNSGSYADIAFNRVLGVGPTAIIAQNGIQAGGGAAADIRYNFVSSNIYTPQTVVSTGILAFDTGRIAVGQNTVTSNDVGAYIINPASGSSASFNRVRASTFDGIAVDTAVGSRFLYNKTDQNGGPGIGVYDSDNNVIEDNLVEDNDDSGILLDTSFPPGGISQMNRVTDNRIRNNGTSGGDTTDGIRATSFTLQNTFRDNELKNNVTHDCHDDSVGSGSKGTANFWIDNEGFTSKPPGLCRKDDDDRDYDDFDRSHSWGWDASYAWYLDGVDADAASYDWPATYATVDTLSPLQLLAVPRLGPAARTNPYQ
jgi:parallel beta-helix repeat protein